MGAGIGVGWLANASSSKTLTLLKDRDQFGGWTGKKFKATGFFRLERDAKRWWLVTPEGNVFLIHGIDHADAPKIARTYNKEYWNRELGLSKETSKEQRLHAFYKKKIAADRKYLGFNCLYSHSAPIGMNVCPYIPRANTLDIEYWRTWHKGFSEENFQDVFSDDFLARCKQTARKIVLSGRHKDPWVLGHALTDSPVLTVQMAMPHHAGFFHKPLPGTTTWPVRLRNLGSGSPGKESYVRLMKKRYQNEIQNFNDTYNTDFESWDTLVATENWRVRTDPTGNMHEEKDNQAFLLQILDKAWGTQVSAIQEHDPNHLIIGDTLNLNTPLSDDVIMLYSKHFPIITYQYYGATWEDHQRILDRLRKIAGDIPVFSADSSWSVKDEPRMPDTLGPQCANYMIAAQRMKEVYHAAFARPEFIGWGWCGWMDQWESAEPIMQHAGLQDAFGKWHQPLAQSLSEFGRNMYNIAQL